ncbi:MAG: hypothetical protein ACR2HC_01190 [Thermoleophilaceae bacterium]
MSKRRFAVPAAVLVVATAIAAPATAGAATLRADKPCYGGGDKLTLLGEGFTPGGTVNLTTNGTTTPLVASRADTRRPGLIRAVAPVLPLTTGTTRTQIFSATDVTNPALTASTPVKRSIVRVLVKPANAGPSKRRRFSARGFTTGTTLYRHVVRGRAVSNSRQGRLKTACRTLSFKRVLFRKTPGSGTYKVQFDTSRKYSSTRAQRVVFRVRVYRIARRSSAASAAATTFGSGTRESWTRVK